MIEIEDIVYEEMRRPGREDGSVQHRVKKIHKKSEEEIHNNHTSDNIIPEKTRIFVQTWGCSHNTSDSEYMAGILQQYGYKVTLGGAQDFSGSGEKHACEVDCCRTTVKEACDFDADLYLFNSCTVKGPAEDHFRNAVLNAKKQGKQVVVAGCVPQGQRQLDYLKNISMIGVQQIDRVIEVVEETLNGNVIHCLQSRIEKSHENTRKRLAGAPLNLPKIRRNPLIEILAISTGCLNACTYCKTKHARGALASYTVEELIERSINAFEDGVKEIWLTSEDLGAYGRDLLRDLSDPVETAASNWYFLNNAASQPLHVKFPKTLSLADLLARLIPVVPKGCMLRLGMTNPPYILDQLEEVAYVLQHPHVYGFLHIPVQSGSDRVLHDMKREYTAEEFQNVVEKTRSLVRKLGDSLTIATDIICGFPTENEADFDATFQLIERYKFPVLYINQFFARPGTPAANMKRIATTAEVKVRTASLHKLFRSYETNSDNLDREMNVLITEASTDGQFWVGHNKAYQQVLVSKEPNLLGKIIRVKVTECHKFYMKCNLLPADSTHLMECDADYEKRILLYEKGIVKTILADSPTSYYELVTKSVRFLLHLIYFFRFLS
ncbi:Threonylcarbamoyladenosine tRNA methylthiotransferase [Cichlidogyrus casuarinus]|uniref:tRNA (N(6)-L-threonylcarbamoyladenosine(37)-C(2))-methylthiotransferase n=1 Tax=Cichlidogyrus casuarinus TaxID=1844966 RepID=A0ABD2QHH2_9PLAT